MTDKIKVYIASPYTNGDKQKLTNLQMDAASELLIMGFNPFTPLLSHYISLYSDMNDFPWLEVDIDWLKLCDIAIRLHPTYESGEEIPSPGADEEEKFCKQNGIPMFHFDNIPEMVRWLQTFHFEK